MQILRLFIVCAATIWLAAAARAQVEIVGSTAEDAESAAAWQTDEHVGDEFAVLEFDAEAAQWSEAEILPSAAVDDASNVSPSQWFAGVELMLLKPRYWVNQEAVGLTENEVIEYRGDTAYAPRLYGGWEGVEGFGARGRFWQLQGDYAYSTYSWMHRPWRLDLSRFDFDVYRRFRFSRGSIVAGGDLAAVDLNLDRLPPVSPHFKTAGLGFFVEGRHQLFESPNTEVALIGRGRWTQFFWGEMDYTEGMLYIPGAVNTPLFAQEQRLTSDAHLQVAEAAAGVELVRKFRRADFVLECAVEAQSWEISPVSDLTFFGSTISASLRL